MAIIRQQWAQLEGKKSGNPLGNPSKTPNNNEAASNNALKK